MKKKSDKGTEIKVEDFSAFLKAVNLGGIIKGCVVKIASGVMETTAVDMTNTIFVYSVIKKAISTDLKKTLGVGDLDLMIRVLSSAKAKKVPVVFKDNRLTLKSDSGAFKYLLTDPDMIASAPPASGGVQKIRDRMTHSLKEFTAETRDNVLSYFQTVKSKEIVLRLHEGKVVLSGGDETGHEYTVPLGKVKGKAKGFKVRYDPEYIAKVLSGLEFEDKYNTRILFGKDEPFLVENTGKNFERVWAIVPNTEG